MVDFSGKLSLNTHLHFNLFSVTTYNHRLFSHSAIGFGKGIGGGGDSHSKFGLHISNHPSLTRLPNPSVKRDHFFSSFFASQGFRNCLYISFDTIYLGCKPLPRDKWTYLGRKHLDCRPYLAKQGIKRLFSRCK